MVIGTPVANRGRMEIEGLIGFFVNTLAMRVEVSGPGDGGRVAGAGEGGDVGGAAASGHTVRAGGGVGAAGEEPGAQSAVPGDVRWQNNPAAAAGTAGSGDTASALWRLMSMAKFDLTLFIAGSGRGDRWRSGVCDSAVRAGDDGAVPGVFAASAGRDGGG